MWKIITLLLIVVGVAAFGFSLVDVTTGDSVTATTTIANPEVDLDGYARAIEPYDWQFPADFGPHPDFQTEWWYYTGNLAAEDGRRFGFQFTVFRRAVLPTDYESVSEWQTNQIYLAHFTVSDIADEAFYHDERYSRGSAGLAGATVDPRYRVWVEDWEIRALNDAATLTQIVAANDEVAIDLTLEQVKPPALQGDGGLSPKSETVGNASYYYTLSRLLTEGTVTVGDETYTVEGVSWKDHEFSTSALDENAQGWDWFGLIFDDGREMMVGKIRLMDGGKEPAFGGLLVHEDGSTTYLPASSFVIDPTDTWTSPHTGVEYPSGWEITVDIGEAQPLVFTATPLLRDQELDANTVYWEGAVELSGDVTGYGYAELTGYQSAMAGFF